MPQLEWNNSGTRFFETGVDRGVLFTTDNVGVAWSGLTAVTETPNGGEVSSFFLDGLKYLQIPGAEDFGGTIEAFTYPDEFGIHDGTLTLDSGMTVMQQRRRPFGLSYRTRIGDDVVGIEAAYKLHIVYNCLAKPSSRQYSSLGDSVEPIKFSWDFSTSPRRPKAEGHYAPLSHIIIDSRKTAPWLLRHIEAMLYGSPRNRAQLISMDELFLLFENPSYVLSIFAEPATGLNHLILETAGTGDLIGDTDSGLYQAVSETRLVETAKPGFYRLDS